MYLARCGFSHSTSALNLAVEGTAVATLATGIACTTHTATRTTSSLKLFEVPHFRRYHHVVRFPWIV